MGEHEEPERLADILRRDMERIYPDKTMPTVYRPDRRHGKARRIWDLPIILRIRTMISAHTGRHT